MSDDATTTGAGAIADTLRDARRRHRLRAARRAQPRAVARVRAAGHPHRRLAPRAGLRVRGRRLRARDRRAGVALTTTGPGAANTLGAVGEAWASHSPVVVIASDIATTLRRPGAYRGVLHECTDQAALFAPVTKARIDVGRADDLGAAVADALALAQRAPRGPVYVGVPTDLLTAPVAGRRSPTCTPRRSRNRAAAAERPRARCCELLAAVASDRCIWIGGGARDAGAEIDARRPRARRARDRDYQARGVLPAEPSAPRRRAAARAAGHRARRAGRLRARVGSDLDHMNTMGWRLPLPDARAPRSTSTAPTRPRTTRWTRSSRPTRASRAAHARSRCSQPTRDAVGRRRRRDRAQRCATSCAPTPSSRPRSSSSSAPAAALPDDAVVFADMCIPGYWLSGQYPVECDRGLHYPMGWGTLGFAFPASIGAAVAVGPQRPGRRGDRRRRHAVRARRARDRRAGAARAHGRGRRRRRLRDAALRARRRSRQRLRPRRPSTSSPSPRASASRPSTSTGSATTTGRRSPKAVASGEPRLIHAHARARPAPHAPHPAGRSSDARAERTADGLPRHLRNPERRRRRAPRRLRPRHRDRARRGSARTTASS